MKTIEELKSLVYAYIDSIAGRIIDHGNELMKLPELGYREVKTSEYVVRELESLGYSDIKRVALTGAAARLNANKSAANVCVIGELDAVLTPDHPQADRLTGAAHSCGHNIQLAQLLGCADALKNSGVFEYLGGDVTFLAVPAEEFVELEYRNSLCEDGKISEMSGKKELIGSGFFDGITCAMMVHSQPNEPSPCCFIDSKSLGFVAKRIRFVGKAAHAGGAPHEGVNALNAAMAAMMCIHAMRETFCDEDKIRVHPIITKGGDLVNIVPADVTMETYVRGATPEAIEDACFKVDRAIKGAAYALGAEAVIEDLGGYAPLAQDSELGRMFEQNALEFILPEAIYHGIDMVGSTDMGDLSLKIPSIQPTFGGYSGGAHSREFRSSDDYVTHILPCKIMTATVIDLLYGNAERAIKLGDDFRVIK